MSASYFPACSAHRRCRPNRIGSFTATSLELFWSPFVDANQVEISVDDGLVTLSGTVDSWREKRVAGENAVEGGALTIENDAVIAN